MKTIKALVFGFLVWIFGVVAFGSIYQLPILRDRYLQANIGLTLLVPPLIWMAAKLYYGKNGTMHGLKLGVLMLITSTIMDALVTVPIMIVPYGGSYASFFGSLDFWLIAFEFVAIATLYWWFNVRPTHTGSSC